MRGPGAIHPSSRRAAQHISACLLVLVGLLAHVALAESPAAEHTPVHTRMLEQFNRSCVLCHVTGEAGAPRVADADAWRARAAKGEAVLLRHTLEGYNDMPPLGYCQDCELADFRALLRFMNPHAPAAD